MVNSQNQSMPEAEFTGRHLVLFREGAIESGIQNTNGTVMAAIIRNGF